MKTILGSKHGETERPPQRPLSFTGVVFDVLLIDRTIVVFVLEYFCISLKMLFYYIKYLIIKVCLTSGLRNSDNKALKTSVGFTCRTSK